MTVIAGLAENGVVYLAADSYGVDGTERIKLAEPKVWQAGRCVVGVSGSHRLLQTVRWCVDVALNPPADEPHAWLVRAYAPALRAAVKEHGGADADGVLDGSILIGCDGCLWHVDSSYAMTRMRGPADAIGCGQAYALGALAAMDSGDPVTRLRRAVRVAIDLDVYCHGPITVVQTRTPIGDIPLTLELRPSAAALLTGVDAA